MAHFRGQLKGARGLASRLGHRSSGLWCEAASWQGKVSVQLYASGDIDMARVSLEPHNGAGKSLLLYHGPVSGRVTEQDILDGKVELAYTATA